MRRSLSIFACALALTLPAAAADEEGNYFIMGEIGSMPCANLHALLRDSDAAAEIGAKLGQWLSGYITALNRLTPKTYNVAPDLAALFIKLSDQCEAEPDLHLEPAAWEVAKKLYPTRVQVMP